MKKNNKLTKAYFSLLKKLDVLDITRERVIREIDRLAKMLGIERPNGGEGAA